MSRLVVVGGLGLGLASFAASALAGVLDAVPPPPCPPCLGDPILCAVRLTVAVIRAALWGQAC
ncbi:MAG TPA: hypothetical protein VGR28_09440 [Candidatus Thermoplasmatota archaeon]|jgi:hypothetical protein|nr:hypothetical protein [Candidatus Thermoplasmatota archaeon]